MSTPDRITGELMNANRLLVAGFDWGTRRVERFHRVIGGFAADCREQGASADRTYEFVRTLGQELGETVNGALFMVATVRHSRPS
ncbi:MAG: hypothetical protein ACOY3X_09655 [Pseudomonadota bacterium]